LLQGSVHTALIKEKSISLIRKYTD